MLALVLAAMAAAVWAVGAVNDNRTMYVHGSVVFVRGGERTPVLVGGDQALSALGAQQMYTLGQNFRTRYVNQVGGPAGLGIQQMQGLTPNFIDNDQFIVQALDTSYLSASAQSFMQGLYPPISSNYTRNGPTVDNVYLLANGTPVDFPLDGYQYAHIHTLGDSDEDVVFLAGNQNCPMATADSDAYETTPEFFHTRTLASNVYQALNVDWFHGHVGKNQLDYLNAYEIYDYLSYAYMHDKTVYDQLNDGASGTEVLDQLRYFADEMAWWRYGNTSTSNFDSDDNALGGKTLSALILGAFQRLVDNHGNTSNSSAHALTLLFGEYEPLVSLFSLMLVDHVNVPFRSIPSFGSAVVFELFSIGDTGLMPGPEDLRVQFYFHNSTEFDGTLQPYPMFDHGPSFMDVSWFEFQTMFSAMMVNKATDWCTRCSSPANFCWGVTDKSPSPVLESDSRKHDKLSPVVAGVIGAVVTLVVAALLFALAMLVGGLRFHRREHKSSLGGYKGSAKLASDADLSIAKNAAAPAGAVVAGQKPDRKVLHERVGSWELRQKEFGTAADTTEGNRRGSFDAIEAALHSPSSGVQPHERV